MQFTRTGDDPVVIETDCLIVPVTAGAEPRPGAAAVDRAADGLLRKLEAEGELPRKRGETLMLHTPAGLGARRLLLCATGEPDKLDRTGFYNMVLGAGKALRESRATTAHCLLAEVDVAGTETVWRAHTAALALDHADYRYTETKQPEKHAPPATGSVSFPEDHTGQAALDRAAAIAAGVRRCRQLGDLPPNLCTPAYMAGVVEELAGGIDGLECEILEDEQLAAQSFHSLLAVARGSTNRPRLIRLSWNGGGGERPYVLVGKGVTFDTGGISLKPRENMDQMKYDMCGAATAIGVVEACARMGLKANVTAVVAAVENMPDGDAYRPGDVITTKSGQTVEVLNTDAEGRMILCDALTWSEQFNARATVDIATLTGACVVALGHHASAVMTPHDDLAGELLSAGETAADRGWRLPLWDDYQEQLDTPFADMRNIGGMPAGSITAGCFLARFAEKQRWAHLDIAGSAWKWGSTDGATGRPVGLLAQWLLDRAE